MSHACGRKSPGFDYTALEGLIADKFGRAEFARLMPMRLSRLDSLLSGDREFSQSEIIRAAALLDICANEVAYHFFTKKV